MRLSRDGVPVVILSHRKREFLPRAIASLRRFGHGITEVFVVDDSGDEEHRRWLADHGYQFSSSSLNGESVGYLEAMRVVWFLAEHQPTRHVLLWEEDFLATRAFSTSHMARVLDRNPTLAQLNLQRQPVYKIERHFGYMESHQRRGYGLTRNSDDGIAWVGRRTPFTTNPGLIRQDVLSVDWPAREVCDAMPGGAEPAMSTVLEHAGYDFGWLGSWNTPYTRHVGTSRKSGSGY